MSTYAEADGVLQKQFGHDEIMALATAGADGRVSVRNVDAYYKDGAVYVATHARSHKMVEILERPACALCKDLFNARGFGENLGNPLRPENQALREELREVFSAFYDRHVNEADPDTCFLKIRLADAVAFTESHKYAIDFTRRTAEKIPFVQDII